MASSSKARKLSWIGLATFAAMQLVPFGREHLNPPARIEPHWDDVRTRELTVRACFDCHSNETRWPWYSWVAPASWLVTNDVMGGRHHLNFSEWDKKQSNADEAAEAVREGDMPLPPYLVLHPEAELTEAERSELAASLERMFGSEHKEH